MSRYYVITHTYTQLHKHTHTHTHTHTHIYIYIYIYIMINNFLSLKQIKLILDFPLNYTNINIS